MERKVLLDSHDIGLELLERDGGCLYDTAVLLDHAGEIALHYRRIQPQWHGRHADPAVYRQGSELPVAQTPFGVLVFLLCGDLFDDEITARVRELAPDSCYSPSRAISAMAVSTRCAGTVRRSGNTLHAFRGAAARR